LALLSYVVGILAINRLPNTWKQDDGRIVIDEAHGIFITLSFVPFSLENLIIGFILFRFFDILKPLGIKKLDQLHNTHGVMLDDTLAGVYANIVLQVIVRWVIV